MNDGAERPHLSTSEAAKRAGVSRPTISRAIKSGDLPAKYDNSARWLIAATDLDAWAAERTPYPAHIQAEQNMSMFMNSKVQALEQAAEQLKSELAGTRERVAGLEAEATGLRDRLADTQANRDRLAGLLEQALQPKPTWIDRLLGRS